MRARRDGKTVQKARHNYEERYSTGLVVLIIGFVALLVASVAPFAAAGPAAEPVSRIWIGPSGDPLPFKTNLEIEEFLRTAEVVEMEEIPVGVTNPRKVWLEKDGIQAKACFRDVDIYHRKAILSQRGVRNNWRDSCRFECAAYELSKLLGLNSIPPVVIRRIEGKDGTLQIWVERATMETDRAKLGISPPDPWRQKMQWQVMRVFDALIYNDDRNGGNILYDSEWNVWMIDHTRSFLRTSKLPEPNQIRHCERNLWEKLRSLDEAEVDESIGEYVESAELKALFQRHKKLVAYIKDQIEKRGEEKVLFSLH